MGVHHEYELTAQGRDLFSLIVALRQWGEDHLFEEGEPHSQLLDASNERPLSRLVVADAEGRALRASDTFVRKVSH